MVWQRLSKFVIVSLLVCFVMAMPLQAQASTYSPYNDGNIGTTQLQYFRDIVSGLSINDSYVACRTGRYEYQLFAGDIKYSNNKFVGASSGSIITVYTIDTDTNSFGSYSYTVTTDNNFSLNANNYLVYSNLGNYPSLEERSVIYDFSSLVILAVIALCALLRPLFSFIYRLRSY